ncbi:MAG TPA: hypothetical protein PK970_14145 [Hyphomicrobiaceae bacterium]|nr:hypothetical protein [Hyphomicrobiaceae bacterium]
MSASIVIANRLRMDQNIAAPDPTESLRSRIRHLYFGRGDDCDTFRYRLFAIDLAIVAYIVLTSFLERTLWITVGDIICGAIVAADFAARFTLNTMSPDDRTFTSENHAWLLGN